MVEKRLGEIVNGTATAMGVRATLDYQRHFPATINHPDQTARAVDIARDVTGSVDPEFPRIMGAEDFSYMLQARPGAFLFFGQGVGAALHHPEFDFNDDAAPIGASFFARLVETTLPVD
jgi:hippurate hydrolase